MSPPLCQRKWTIVCWNSTIFRWTFFRWSATFYCTCMLRNQNYWLIWCRDSVGQKAGMLWTLNVLIVSNCFGRATPNKSVLTRRERRFLWPAGRWSYDGWFVGAELLSFVERYACRVIRHRWQLAHDFGWLPMISMSLCLLARYRTICPRSVRNFCWLIALPGFIYPNFTADCFVVVAHVVETFLVGCDFKNWVWTSQIWTGFTH